MSVRRGILFIFMIITLALASCAPGTSPLGTAPLGTTPLGVSQMDPNASLSEVSGLAEVQNPGGTTFAPAADGGILLLLGQVRTGEDGHLRLDLAGGTIVRVGPESLLTLQSNETTAYGLQTILTLEAGQAWVVLNGGSLEIQTGAGKARVQGSYMSVAIDPLSLDVKVYCLEGSCQAENTSAKKNLLAGQGCTLFATNPDGSTPPPAPQETLMSSQDIEKFLAANPEAASVMNAVYATSTALPPVEPPPDPVVPEACFLLSQPAQGSQVTTSEPLSFEWDDQPGAYKYILTLVKPNGEQRTRLAWQSNLSLDQTNMPVAGTYSWQVTAYDSSYQPICTAGPWTFTRPAAPVPTASGDCFQLVSPANGSELPGSGPVTFSWQEQPGRFKYIFNLISPSGNEQDTKVYTTSYEREMAKHPAEGTYTWLVTAYDSNYEPICTAGPWTFSKPGVPVPTTIPGQCVSLLTPANGTAFNGSNRVDFTWTEYPQAYKYIISFKPPSTPAVTFLAWEPLHTRYVESLPEGGTYQWWVTVKDSNLNVMCTSEIFTFTKENTSYLYPTAAAGSGSFWGLSGPTGAQASCDELDFGVSTSLEGMIKIVYSFTNPSPDGYSDPHIVIGNGPGTASAKVCDFCGYSGPVYYRFAVIHDGTYTHDSNIFSFSCP